ncbi:MAG: spore germination protein [Desulfotomaculum sp.]|nr:spore germination protein [Desulfotomaculum sp.]
MKDKRALQKLLGFMPQLGSTSVGEKPFAIPADPVLHVFDDHELEGMQVDSQLSVNIDALRTIMAGNGDFVVRDFVVGSGKEVPAAVVYIDGMIDITQINENIMKPLMIYSKTGDSGSGPDLSMDMLAQNLITHCDMCQVEDYKAIFPGILFGDALILLDGHKKALIVRVKGFEKRSISEPVAETVIRGPQEGFTEDLRTNTVLIRRRLQTPNLIMENMIIGRIAHTNVVIAYVRGLVDPQLVQEIKKRLCRIDIEGLIASGIIEQLIEDDPYSPFPQLNYTERPDRVMGNLMEGRAAILVNGAPTVLIAPGELISLTQSPEDYYERFYSSSFLRLIRWFALTISLLLPSVYIAVITFHQEMIPTPLLISIAASRAGVPFPALIEALIMEFAFEVLREAGVRMPRPVGQAVSIVGALVIGQAAVQAGIVSAPMVIIVALTGIASFVNPSFGLPITLRLLRFPLMFLAGMLGFFGITAGILMMLIHLVGLRSFGVPYLSPLAPYHQSGMKDMFIRAPLWALPKRPGEVAKDNLYRMAPGMKPGPEQNKLEKQQLQNKNNRDIKSSAWPEERRRQMEHADLNVLSDANLKNQQRQGGGLVGILQPSKTKKERYRKQRLRKQK